MLDDDTLVKAQNPAGLGFDITVPGTYARLAADAKGKWGHKPLHRHGWTDLAAASRYVRLMQSRRSLLIWKVYGERLDGWQNDDFPYETIPGDPTSLRHKGKPVAGHAAEPRDCRTSATPAASCRRRKRCKARQGQRR